MPFEKVNIKNRIKQKCDENPQFKTAYKAIDKEYKLIAQAVSLRKEQRISQKDIQKNCGMTQQAISRLEKAEISTTLRNFIKYLDATGFELVVQKKQEQSNLKNLSAANEEALKDYTITK
jgi:transcriptional regulator with XRE-family HTH domain